MLNISAVLRDVQFPLKSQEYPPASRTFPFGRSMAGADRAAAKLDVLLDVALSGSYNSALVRYEHETALGQLIPPAMSIIPLLSKVALWPYRLVLRVALVDVPTVSVALPETEPVVAVIVVAPAAMAVTYPVALMVATFGFDETHVLEAVRSVEE